jgi:preprotein translocase SecE subunit
VAEAVVRTGGVGRMVSGVRAYVADVMAELRRVTWPDTGQVRQLSIGVIVLSLFVGGVIWVIDLILQLVLVRGIPSLFGG